MTRLALLVVTSLPLCGCASIVSKSVYPVDVEASSAGVPFSIYDRKGEVVTQGVTPQRVTLPAKYKPFIPARYTVQYGTPGAARTKELNATLDPWFFGNVLVGGVFGLVIDPMTGAMFKLPHEVNGTVVGGYAQSSPEPAGVVPAGFEQPAEPGLAQ